MFKEMIKDKDSMENNIVEDISIEKIKQESLYLLLALAASIIILQIVFHKGSLYTNIITSLSLFWIFILPGFMLMFCYHKHLDFLQRFILGSGLGFAIIGTASYYAGLFGLHIRYHTIILPISMMIIAVLINLPKKQNQKHS